METQEWSVDTPRVDPPLHWHFRALPMDVQRGAIRRLALSGVAEKEIAARIGWSVDAVQRALLEDECLTHLMALHRPTPTHSRVI